MRDSRVELIYLKEGTGTLFVLRVGSVDDGRYVYRLDGWNPSTEEFDCTMVARHHGDLDCFIDAPDNMKKASIGDVFVERVFLTKHELLGGGHVYRLVERTPHD